MKNPLPMMRELYSTLLEASSKVMKGKQENTRKETDAEVEVLTQTCTCATQYIQISDKTCSCMKVDKNLIKEFGDTANIEEYSTDITESSVTLSTISLTDETKTDTTECNRVAIDFEVSPRRGKPKRNVRKIKVEFITKANQGTATDKAKLCDVSTITSDWWSPLVDRKHGKVHLSSGEMYKSIEHSGLYSDRSVSADGKIVTFKSRAQMIPPGKGIIWLPVYNS
ncbi:jg11598 [Pararge aegeria aegeria]|uniref:Jg11598 protein n=1 Tax=Pararge aegeria aegeria TaxID=348720 RepID=A0A8S4RU53_9NEOP|nr:jg11598 [Pararge aegeria aegeria]